MGSNPVSRAKTKKMKDNKVVGEISSSKKEPSYSIIEIITAIAMGLLMYILFEPILF